MKTLKSIFAISAILLVSGYTYATGKGPGDSKNVNSSVREKIATAIQSADIQGQGQVTLKFGVTEKNDLQLFNVESSDKGLSKEIKDALAGSKIKFPQGSSGVYKINLRVNDVEENANYNALRAQVMDVVNNIQGSKSESVDVKIRVINPYYVKVLKAESADPKLAAKVKQSLENERLYVPKKLNGDYTVKVTFK